MQPYFMANYDENSMGGWMDGSVVRWICQVVIGQSGGQKGDQIQRSMMNESTYDVCMYICMRLMIYTNTTSSHNKGGIWMEVEIKHMSMGVQA